MEEVCVVLERHDQHIKSLQHQVDDLKGVQSEIKVMSETLITLTNEIKHTNEHMARQEQRIEEIEKQPRARLNQITTAIIAALAGGIITAIISAIIANI